MKGATADPEVRTINPPSKTSQIIIGKSQNFFRSFINDHRSIKKSPIGYLQELFLYREEMECLMNEQRCQNRIALRYITKRSG